MKNLLIYVNPRKWFDEEGSALIKVQIDNSLELGWQIGDIMLMTNFDYEYRGVKSIHIDDDVFCEYSPISTKVPALLRMFEMGLIGDELYWMHDLDCYQLVTISDKEMEMSEDMGLCDYGRFPKWEGGSIFLKKAARDIFEKQWHLFETQYCRRWADEDALYKLTNEDENIRNRVKKLDISYSFKPFNIRSCWRMALKPLRVAHFHPLRGRLKLSIPKLLDFFKGKNKINQQLIPDRLINLFERHGIT